MIVILKPFSSNSQLQNCKIQLGMEKVFSNLNRKIWFFWDHEGNCRVIESDDQQITCEIQHNQLPHKFISIYIYAKCRDHLKNPPWERLLHLSNLFDGYPWCVVGDFNVIYSTNEKLGEIPYNIKKSFDFTTVKDGCGQMDLGYSGQKYTWSNNRGVIFRVWKRSDRVMVNDKWLALMPQTTNTHLPIVSSDHFPLLLEMSTRSNNDVKYF